MINAQPTFTYGGWMDNDDAFNVGDKIGLDGILPVTNTPTYTPKTAPPTIDEFLSPFGINGLEISVTGFDPATNRYTLQIDFTQYEIRHNKRW